jgi:hypothetical protein
MKQVSTEGPILFAKHTFKTKKGERKVETPVFGINYLDNSRYPRGKMKPCMYSIPLPVATTAQDISHIAAAVAKRERKNARRAAH